MYIIIVLLALIWLAIIIRPTNKPDRINLHCIESKLERIVDELEKMNTIPIKKYTTFREMYDDSTPIQQDRLVKFLYDSGMTQEEINKMKFE